MTEEYHNKKGIKSSYVRTARVNKEASINDLYVLLQEMATKYLVHRFFVSADKLFWPSFKSSSKHHIITLDYSENINNLSLKHGVLTLVGNSKPCIVNCLKKKVNYLFHTMCLMIRTTILTLEIIRDLIEKHPYIISSGNLVLRSDNCAMQYKSQFVFNGLKKLAIEYDINIIWFYGIAGHGKGTVDAMSSFGCKAILRNAIITDDLMFNNANEMCTYLNDKKTDSNRYYQIIDSKITAKKRQGKKVGYPLQGSRSFHMIAVNPQGNFQTRVILDIDEQLEFMFFFDDTENNSSLINECHLDVDDIVDEDNDVSIYADILLLPMVYEGVEPDSYVGLRPSATSMELFYVCKVMSKNIATKEEIDDFGHVIATGEPYLTVVYLDYQTESHKYVKFGIPSKNKLKRIYVHIGEVFATNIEIKDDLTMDINEYRSLCSELY